MAEAAVQAPTAANQPKYFCHKCSVSVDLSPELPELTCPKCESGFVEELTRDLQAEQSANENTPQGMFLNAPTLPSLFSSLMLHPSSDDDFDEDSDDEDEEEESAGDRLLMRGLRRRRRIRRRSRQNIAWPPEPRGFFPRFIEDLIRDLTGGNSGQMSTLLPFLPPIFHGDPRDYAWGADGLDNAITQLLNQWESPGSPPASKEDIENLPLVTIAQEHIDGESQCSVCMEDFHLEDVVRSLPCQHLFHTDCINPWLHLHNTCPICRKTLGTPTADAEDTNAQDATDATDTTDSGDSDNSSDSSNENVDDGAVNASSSAANAGNDLIADEPAECAADIPDNTLWDFQPDISTRTSATHQTDQGRHVYRRRSSSSSSSSSSEYSSL